MTIFLAGATGRVATELLKLLSQDGQDVRAGARRPEAVVDLPHVTSIAMDLNESVDELAELVSGSQAIIFAAGSRGKDLLQTDAYGAVKLMQAAEKVGVKRFIMLSALYSLIPEKWPTSLKEYYIAKYFADNYLMSQTQLDYTILQPGALVEEEAIGRFSLTSTGTSSIAIPDVAAALAYLIDSPQTIGKVIEIHPGEEKLEEIL